MRNPPVTLLAKNREATDVNEPGVKVEEHCEERDAGSPVLPD